MSKNPYRVRPVAQLKKSDDDIVPRSKDALLFPAIMLFTTFCGTWIAPLVINWFDEVFRRFDGKLPGITKIILATRYGWAIFLVVAIALTVWIGKPKQQTRGELRVKNRAMIVFSVVYGVAITIAYYGLYLPLFSMAKII